eukprot:scaffold1655_cov94-Isochrysis_galbana.AAC.3
MKGASVALHPERPSGTSPASGLSGSPAATSSASACSAAPPADGVLREAAVSGAERRRERSGVKGHRGRHQPERKGERGKEEDRAEGVHALRKGGERLDCTGLRGQRARGEEGAEGCARAGGGRGEIIIY